MVFKKGDVGFWKGKKRPKETNRKISESNKGKHKAPETEFKKGHTSWIVGKHHSEETKLKISNSKKGQIPWNKGKKGYVSKEVWQNRPQCQKGEASPLWKGGRKMVKAREHHKRRSFGFIPINNCDDSNWVAHHLDKNYVLFIPPEIHRSVRHSLVNNINMDVINKIAVNWYSDYILTGSPNKDKIDESWFLRR